MQRQAPHVCVSYESTSCVQLQVTALPMCALLCQYSTPRGFFSTWFSSCPQFVFSRCFLYCVLIFPSLEHPLDLNCIILCCACSGNKGQRRLLVLIAVTTAGGLPSIVKRSALRITISFSASCKIYIIYVMDDWCISCRSDWPSDQQQNSKFTTARIRLWRLCKYQRPHNNWSTLRRHKYAWKCVYLGILAILASVMLNGGLTVSASVDSEHSQPICFEGEFWPMKSNLDKFCGPQKPEISVSKCAYSACFIIVVIEYKVLNKESDRRRPWAVFVVLVTRTRLCWIIVCQTSETPPLKIAYNCVGVLHIDIEHMLPLTSTVSN